MNRPDNRFWVQDSTQHTAHHTKHIGTPSKECQTRTLRLLHYRPTATILEDLWNTAEIALMEPTDSHIMCDTPPQAMATRNDRRFWDVRTLLVSTRLETLDQTIVDEWKAALTDTVTTADVACTLQDHGNLPHTWGTVIKQK